MVVMFSYDFSRFNGSQSPFFMKKCQYYFNLLLLQKLYLILTEKGIWNFLSQTIYQRSAPNVKFGTKWLKKRK